MYGKKKNSLEGSKNCHKKQQRNFHLQRSSILSLNKDIGFVQAYYTLPSLLSKKKEQRLQ